MSNPKSPSPRKTRVRLATANLNPEMSNAALIGGLRKIVRQVRPDRISFQEISTRRQRRILTRVMREQGYAVRLGRFGLAEAWNKKTLQAGRLGWAKDAPLFRNFLTHKGRAKISPNRGYSTIRLIIRSLSLGWPNVNTHGVSGVRPNVRKTTQQGWRMSQAEIHWEAINKLLAGFRFGNAKRKKSGKPARLITFAADMNNNLREDDEPWRPYFTVRPHLAAWSDHSIDVVALVKTSPARQTDKGTLEVPGADHLCVWAEYEVTAPRQKDVS